MVLMVGVVEVIVVVVVLGGGCLVVLGGMWLVYDGWWGLGG